MLKPHWRRLGFWDGVVVQGRGGEEGKSKWRDRGRELGDGVWGWGSGAGLVFIVNDSPAVARGAQLLSCQSRLTHLRKQSHQCFALGKY